MFSNNCLNIQSFNFQLFVKYLLTSHINTLQKSYCFMLIIHSFFNEFIVSCLVFFGLLQNLCETTQIIQLIFPVFEVLVCMCVHRGVFYSFFGWSFLVFETPKRALLIKQFTPPGNTPHPPPPLLGLFLE